MKNVRLNFGMPELLVIFSFLIFTTSKWFSITAFCMAILGKMCVVALEMNRKEEESKKKKRAINSAGNQTQKLKSN